MIKSSYPHSFLLAIASVLLLLFTIANCNNNNNNDQMKPILFEKRLPSTTTDHLNDLLEQENFIDGDVNIFIRDLLKPYPSRRSFHAMRGKRRVILP